MFEYCFNYLDKDNILFKYLSNGLIEYYKYVECYNFPDLSNSFVRIITRNFIFI